MHMERLQIQLLMTRLRMNVTWRSGQGAQLV